MLNDPLNENRQHAAMPIMADVTPGIVSRLKTISEGGAKLKVDHKRKIYQHLAQDNPVANALQMQAGGALMIKHESQLILSDGIGAEVLVFELP